MAVLEKLTGQMGAVVPTPTCPPVRTVNRVDVVRTEVLVVLAESNRGNITFAVTVLVVKVDATRFAKLMVEPVILDTVIVTELRVLPTRVE